MDWNFSDNDLTCPEIFFWFNIRVFYTSCTASHQARINHWAFWPRKFHLFKNFLYIICVVWIWNFNFRIINYYVCSKLQLKLCRESRVLHLFCPCLRRAAGWRLQGPICSHHTAVYSRHIPCSVQLMTQIQTPSPRFSISIYFIQTGKSGKWTRKCWTLASVVLLVALSGCAGCRHLILTRLAVSLR